MPTPSIDLLSLAQARVNPALSEALDRLGEALPADGHPLGHIAPESLVEAMKYALLAPGKRLRPALVFGGLLAVDGAPDDGLPAACAVEMVHAYSLVHDDLPALDNDDERRGQPSCHIKYGEATALLAGDALLTEAFAVLSAPRTFEAGQPVAAEYRLAALSEFARAVGAAGMVGGQVDDIAAEARPADNRRLEMIHRRKTGRLIQASVVMGGLYGGGSASQIAALRTFGAELGLAFQLIDDILDGDGAVHLRGPETVRTEAQAVTQRALDALQDFGEAGVGLKALAQTMAKRIV